MAKLKYYPVRVEPNAWTLPGYERAISVVDSARSCRAAARYALDNYGRQGYVLAERGDGNRRWMLPAAGIWEVGVRRTLRDRD